MYKQVLDPVSNSLGITSIFAVLPLLVLFVLLGVVRMKAWLASLITLGVAIIVAVAVYSMPIGQAGDAGQVELDRELVLILPDCARHRGPPLGQCPAITPEGAIKEAIHLAPKLSEWLLEGGPGAAANHG